VPAPMPQEPAAGVVDYREMEIGECRGTGQIANEGFDLVPSLAQHDEAVREFSAEIPDAKGDGVVEPRSARIDVSERGLYEAEANGEIVSHRPVR